MKVEAAVERENNFVLRAAADSTKITFAEILKAIEDSIDDVTTSDEEQDQDKAEVGEDNNNTELSDDYKSDWAVGTVNKLVQKWLNTFQAK